MDVCQIPCEIDPPKGQSKMMVLIGDINGAVFDWRQNLDSKQWTITACNLSRVRTENELFIMFASAFQYPLYFGHNWDANDECLSEIFEGDKRNHLLIFALSDEIGKRNRKLFTKLIKALKFAVSERGQNDGPILVCIHFSKINDPIIEFMNSI